MLWQEEPPVVEIPITTEVVDLAFSINCRCLPLDHAYPLSQAICQVLPWMLEEPLAGIHLIHGADSGNGWYRPDAQGSLLYLSQRTKLTLRLPQSSLAQARTLSGTTLDVQGYPLQIGKAIVKPLLSTPVLFARHLIASPEPEQEEEVFLYAMVEQLQTLGIHCRKALCGKSFVFTLPQGNLLTRSFMVADLKPQESIILQQRGLGAERLMGCGLFIPHKNIEAVNPLREKSVD